MKLDKHFVNIAVVSALLWSTSAIAFELIEDFGTTVNRVTSASDAAVLTPQFIRHEYSRRAAFNADGSLAIMYSSNGFFHLYATNTDNTLRYIRVLDQIGGGTIEPNWHPTNPNLLYTFNGYGIGMQLNVFDVRDQTRINVIDMASKINALGGGFATADRAFTGEEGRPSLDGNIWCLAVYSGEEWEMRGMVAYDLALDQVIAYRELTEGLDAISTSANGEYCLSISGYNGSGIRSYPIADRSFGTFRQIHQAPEHVDLALDADGRDVLVYIDSQNDGYVKAVDLETGKVVRFFDTWDTRSPPAAHFSGLGFSQPGWIIVSMFGGDNVSFYSNKILAVEIAENPRIIVLGDARYNGGGYWGQPQATVNKQLDKVLFSSNASGTIADYMISLNQTLPAARGILETAESPAPGAPPSVPEPAPGPEVTTPEEFVLVTPPQISFQLDGEVTIVVETTTVAQCRWDYSDGSAYPYGVLYQDMNSTDGLTHAFTEYAWNDHVLYVVCRTLAGAETDAVIPVRREVPAVSPPGSDPVVAPEVPTAGLQVNGDSRVYFQSDGDITFTIQTSGVAQCRWDYSDGSVYAFDVLYQNLVTNDGLTHSFVEYVWNDHNLYVVCKATDDAEVSTSIEVIRSAAAETVPDFAGDIPASLEVSGDSPVLFQEDGNLAISIQTSDWAQCRWDYSDGGAYPYDVLYQNLDSSDGLTHSFNEFAWNDHDLYIVCKTPDGVEQDQTIQVRRGSYN